MSMAFSEQEKDEIAAAAWEAYRQHLDRSQIKMASLKWEELDTITQESWRRATQAAINQWAMIAHRGHAV